MAFLISIDNGLSYIGPDEFDAELRLKMEKERQDLILKVMDAMEPELRRRLQDEMVPCSFRDFLEKYLELADSHLVIS